MSIQLKSVFTVCMVSSAMLAPSLAHAALVISDKPTRNVECDGHGACKAQAKNAVLNIQDVENALAAYSLTIIAGGPAKDIVVNSALSWTNSNELSFEAARSVIVEKPIMVEGGGALSVVTTNEQGGENGELAFVKKGNVSFSNCYGGLLLNNAKYTLVCSIRMLADYIEEDPAGNYALGLDYDASSDGTYEKSPVQASLTGAFQGLGNTISNLSFATEMYSSTPNLGLFGVPSGTISNLNLTHVTMQDSDPGQSRCFGPLADTNEGFVSHVSVSSIMSYPQAAHAIVGGVVCNNVGTITDSHAQIALDYLNGDVREEVGAIAGINKGDILSSYAEGRLRTSDVAWSPGGIAGANAGRVKNSYSLVKTSGGAGSSGYFGGLVGDNGGIVISSYAAGKMMHTKMYGKTVGGIVGYEENQSGGLSKSYWDFDDGVSDPSAAAGNIANYPGGTGLTTAQLQSGLPDGFDPKIWAENPVINNGLPYLISNPPGK